MRFVATRKAEQNARGLDPWTLVHFSSGLALGLVDAPLRASLLAAVVYDHFGLVVAVFFALMGIDIIFQWMRGIR